MEEVVAPQFTKEQTLNFRFPYKLWILINTPNSAVSWGRNGATVLLDYIALDRYLSSALSIFRATKTCFAFIRQLSIHGFQKVVDGTTNVPPNGVFFEFENPNFVQNRADLLDDVVEVGVQKQMPKLLQHSRPMRSEDPCSSAIRALSAIEKARLNLRLILQMQTENYTLNKKLSECEQSSTSAVSVIELPADAFENPFDSISRFDENPEYAGYYGNASAEQIKLFFDEYLPVYAQANNNEIIEKSAQSQSRRDMSATWFIGSRGNSFERMRRRNR